MRTCSVLLWTSKEVIMKGIVAYMLGVPIVVIVVLYITHVF